MIVSFFDMNCVECPQWQIQLVEICIGLLISVTFYLRNATSSHHHGFVFCCQGIALPVLVRILYGLLSL